MPRSSSTGTCRTRTTTPGPGQGAVRRESLKAIRAAGENGWFILSTGDQCGRDTPDANIREMVTVVNEFGAYPLDLGRIDREVRRLG